MGKNNKAKKRIALKFDEKDREAFLRNQGKKHSKYERKKYLERKKNENKRKERIEKNKIKKEEIEKRYNELKEMQNEINKYADLDEEEYDEEEND